jgi:hypothetical protein
MRWFVPSLRSSLSAMFTSGPPAGPQDSLPEIDMEDIRQSMLALVGDVEDKRSVHVGRRIRFAPDAIGLWYLRGDLLALLASRHGEARAWEELEPITSMFEDLLPRGLRSRPSPLRSLSHE